MNTRPMCLPLLLALAVVLVAPPAGAQVPYGYELIEITDDCCYSGAPALNNRGQIAFERRGADATEGDIFLWDDGSLFRITDDAVHNGNPSMNQNGDVVWRRITGPAGATDVFLYRDDEIIQVTDTSDFEQAEAIGNSGEVLYSWYLSSLDTRLLTWNNGVITQLSPPGLSNQSGQINDFGDLVWTRYDFGVSPWESEIVMLSEGEFIVLSDGDFEPQLPTLNNLRQAAWDDQYWRLFFWEAGQTTLYFENGRGPDLNDRGHLVFTRRADDNSILVLYSGTSVTDLALLGRNGSGDLNDYGDVVWLHTIYPLQDSRNQVLLLRRLRVPGDVDEDEDCDLADFAALQRCYGLSGPDVVLDCVLPDQDRDKDVDADDASSLYLSLTGPLLRGDVDGDGNVDLRDFAHLQACFEPAGTVTREACMRADVNDDWTVDQADAAALFLAMTDTLG